MRASSSLRIVAAAFVVIAVMTPAIASGQVVHNNGVPDNINGYNVTANQWTTANDFTIGAASKKGGQTVLNSFDIYVLHDPVLSGTVTSSFFWQILNDDGGLPGSTVVAGGSVTDATGVLTPFFCCAPQHYLDAYLFSAPLGDITIGSGIFWLAVGGFMSSDESLWYWATSSQTGNQAQSFQGAAWETVSSEGAFVLYGSTSTQTPTVPEPGTLILTASGLAGLAGYRIRRRKQS